VLANDDDEEDEDDGDVVVDLIGLLFGDSFVGVVDAVAARRVSISLMQSVGRYTQKLC